MNRSRAYVENLFNTRHSIRQFGEDKVKIEDIKKAIELAQRAPSACNRQAVRVSYQYILIFLY